MIAILTPLHASTTSVVVTTPLRSGKALSNNSILTPFKASSVGGILSMCRITGWSAPKHHSPSNHEDKCLPNLSRGSSNEDANWFFGHCKNHKEKKGDKTMPANLPYHWHSQTLSFRYHHPMVSHPRVQSHIQKCANTKSKSIPRSNGLRTTHWKPFT